MRRAARVDQNQGNIVDALRKTGGSVLSLAAHGRGCPDVLFGYGGRTFLCEIKDGAKPPSARKLTPDQVAFRKDWKGDWTLLESIKDVQHFIAQIDYDLKEWK